MHLSVFWRLALALFTIILMMAGVNMYALVQLQELTALSAGLVSDHFPSIEAAKRLLDSLYVQLGSEKKFRVLRDRTVFKGFEEEGAVFGRELSRLRLKEASDQGGRLLAEVERLHGEYRKLVRSNLDRPPDPLPAEALKHYDSARDLLLTRLTDALQSYVALHEAAVTTGLSDSHARTVQAEVITEQLVIVAVFLALALAGIASYTILHPLRQLQEHIRHIGQGRFGKAVQVKAPSELRELVDTVNWMANKLQKLDDMKAEFLAHVSHELRTPLASIREGTQLMLDQIPGPVTQDQRDTLLIMADSCERLIRLISTLLDLSKMEAGMMEYRFALTDLKRVAEISVSKVRLLAEGKRIKILTEIPDEKPRVPADTARIEQVLDNLLSNALKFSREGGVVKLSVIAQSKTGLVKLSVSDTGQGISPEDLPHIFERFYQGRRQGKPGLAGSGLGLAFAKKVVEAHKGRIWAESEPGKGTAVHFVLPMTRSDGGQT